jgi:hypothetical protein
MSKTDSQLAQALHTAVCEAVAIFNTAIEVARLPDGRKVHDILRNALVEYADAYMDQPAPESERVAVARKHRAHRQPLLRK